MNPFKQIVAEQSILAHLACQAALESRDIINPFANVTAFAKQILINVRDSKGVQVKPGVPGKDLRKERTVRAGRLDRHARLQHGITRDNGASVRGKLGMVKRMRQGGDQPVGAALRQGGIRIQRDHIFDVRQNARVPNLGGVRRLAQIEQQAIEVRQFAALAFPAHPNPFRRIPLAMTMK